MRVFIAGAHGKIGLRLVRLLSNRGDDVFGMARSNDQLADIDQAGGRPILGDLERDDHFEVGGVDAVVFTAGAGAGGGVERKKAVDHAGVTKLIASARERNVDRFITISAMRTDRRPSTWPEAMRPYYEVKLAADEELTASGLSYTIVRPGRLTDDASTGEVAIEHHLEYGGSIPRSDVAAVIAAVLGADNTIGADFDLLSGSTPIDRAVAAYPGPQ